MCNVHSPISPVRLRRTGIYVPYCVAPSDATTCVRSALGEPSSLGKFSCAKYQYYEVATRYVGVLEAFAARLLHRTGCRWMFTHCCYLLNRRKRWGVLKLKVSTREVSSPRYRLQLTVLEYVAIEPVEST